MLYGVPQWGSWMAPHCSMEQEDALTWVFSEEEEAEGSPHRKPGQGPACSAPLGPQTPLCLT